MEQTVPTPPGAIRDGPELTIPALFERRLSLTPDAPAYLVHDGETWRPMSWRGMGERVRCLRTALRRSGCAPGDRVALFLPNGVDWIAADVAAISEGFVTVPLYTRDSADNVRYVMENAGVRLCLVDTAERWADLVAQAGLPGSVKKVWALGSGAGPIAAAAAIDPRLTALPEAGYAVPECPQALPPVVRDALATIVYTSGTTGPPKGVMLTHRSILSNAQAIADVNWAGVGDVFLSLLPLAHGFERTIGCYLPVMGGATVAFNRAISLLRDDLAAVRPTILLAVPRLFERITTAIRAEAEKKLLGSLLLRWTEAIGWKRHEASIGLAAGPGSLGRIFWALVGARIAERVRGVFGGRLRITLSGGAPLAAGTSRFMLSMGVPLIEGYGLTEAGPAVTGSSLEARRPGSVGLALPGVELKLGQHDELLVRSPGNMLGYWDNAEATAQALDARGWLHTGDIAEFRDGWVFIRGRIKDILVLSTGENVNPVAIEAALAGDPLIEQVCVLGNGQPTCRAVVVVNRDEWASLAAAIGCDRARPNTTEGRSAILDRLSPLMAGIPRFAHIQDVFVELEPWSLDSGLITPTLKPKRQRVLEVYSSAFEALEPHVKVSIGVQS